MLIRLRGKRPRQWITPNRDMRRVDGQILPNGVVFTDSEGSATNEPRICYSFLGGPREVDCMSVCNADAALRRLEDCHPDRRSHSD